MHGPARIVWADLTPLSLQGWRKWPMLRTRTFDSFFSTGIVAVHGTDPCETGAPTGVDLGTTSGCGGGGTAPCFLAPFLFILGKVPVYSYERMDRKWPCKVTWRPARTGGFR